MTKKTTKTGNAAAQSYRSDQEFLLDTLRKILEIPSPSGFTHEVMKEIAHMADGMGYATTRNRKGGLLIHVPGKSKKTVCLSVHADTNGAMVSSIESGGNLRFKRVGGPIAPTIDSEYCTIVCRKTGKSYRGTFLSDSPSAHVHPDASSRKRDTDNMYIRLDADVRSKEDTEKLGIAPGDYVAIDVKFERAGGFVKSRFLDDKASVATVLAVLKYLSDNKLKPRDNLIVMCTNYEEVGHGASFIPAEIEEMLAVDMGCIGLDLSCTEKDVSICAMDSSGPYDYELTNNLIELARAHEIPHAVDIYPMYGSDASAAMRGGNNIRAALIGPGIQASHGMERTHETALFATAELILHYLGV